MGIFFSFVIPVYNGAQCVKQCLDSIYQQGLNENDFEVICVNDASTDNTEDVISNYGKSHSNLKLITFPRNRRQGAARNEGVRQACGEYILYIDADDTFVQGALLTLKETLMQHRGIDLLKFTYSVVNNGIEEKQSYPHDSQDEMSGQEFIKRNNIPWVPWLCAYRREFLLKNNLSFEENVRFEDTDYIMKCIMYARQMAYNPIWIYRYYIYDIRTTQVGHNKTKIEEIFRLSSRILRLYQENLSIDKEAAAVIKSHYEFMYKQNIMRYLWLLPKKARREILKKYPPAQASSDKLLSFIGKHPTLFLTGISIVKPLLPFARKAYLLVRNTKNRK